MKRTQPALTKQSIRFLGLFVVAIIGYASKVSALDMRPVLSNEIARQAADACEAMAAEHGWHVAIAIKNTSGDLIYFTRMDDTFKKAIDVSMLKAEAASTTPFSTLELRNLALERDDLPHGIEHVPGIVVFDGGVPIKMKDGVQLGGVGVSGASSQQDGDCARAAVSSIATVLEQR